jgi:cob(I)alamin adenosyltransferase
MSQKIYTKTGDKGETSLLGGTRLPKHHIRIEAYGTVDELNSHIGLLRDVADDTAIETVLIRVQENLFTIGSNLAADPVKNKMALPSIEESDIVQLENEIDRMSAGLPEMKSFVLPGGHIHVSYCHIARCVCRRAERAVIHLGSVEKVDPLHIKYVNRLSDYLFMLARWFTKARHANEIPWKPRQAK